MITVIGSGYIGSFIADYLAGNDETVVVDRSEKALSNCRVARTVQGDVISASDIVRKSDLVVVALPGNSAAESLRHVAAMGKDTVDISFIEEDTYELGKQFSSNGAFYVPHCGFAPGLTNMLAGAMDSQGFNERIDIYCGGLPLARENVLNYAVTWSPEGLIDEYTRKARYIKDGRQQERDPLEDIEEIDIGEYGHFEAFYSDGLSTLLSSTTIRNVTEKTLRYPGHIEKIRFMKGLGMFSDSTIDGVRFRDFTARLIEELPGSKKDQCILLVRGFDGTGRVKEYIGYDSFDEEENRTSMCRMTGLTCASVAISLLDDPVTGTGVIEPEMLGTDRGRRSSVISRLTASGVRLTEI